MLGAPDARGYAKGTVLQAVTHVVGRTLPAKTAR